MADPRITQIETPTDGALRAAFAAKYGYVPDPAADEDVEDFAIFCAGAHAGIAAARSLQASQASQPQEALTVPAGWKLVPVEPTPEMVDAMGEYEPHPDKTLIGMYKAALAAAPQAEQPAWCEVHQHRKWCNHNGGVMGPTGYEAPKQPAQQAVRMLTAEEAKSCMEWTLLASEVDAIQRKFCEVNGIALPPAAQERQ